MRWAKCLLLVVSVATALPTEDREAKSFSLFSVVSFPNEPCATAMANMQGICVTAEQCDDRKGTKSGNCASGFGVCCFTSVDDTMATITNDMTYVSNPGFPTPVTAGTATQTFTYPIQALATTAAIRLEFQTGVFTQPATGTGACSSDTITTTAAATGTTQTLTLCGTLTGQHLYLDNNGMANMANQLAISITTATFSRSWKILVRILEVGDPDIEGRPSGCLQWFTGETGRIRSFNDLNGAAQGRIIGGLNYAICIRPDGKKGCVDIRESGGTVDSFRLDNTQSNTNSEVGGCTDTFLTIPNTGVKTPTYCGAKLAATDAQSQASVVRSTGHVINFVSSNANRAADSSFDLMYTQVEC